jgi:hypothetical protein
MKVKKEIFDLIVMKLLVSLTNSASKNPLLLDIQCFEIHNSIITFCASAHPKDHSCEVSLQSDQKHFSSTFHGYHGNGGHCENVKP